MVYEPMSVTPRGMSVQEAYNQFRSGNFRVNRRYQRKLVWSVQEKSALIDSLLKTYVDCDVFGQPSGVESACANQS